MKLASNKTPKEETNVLDILNSTKPEKRKATIKLKATPVKKSKKEVKPTSSKPKPEKKKKGRHPSILHFTLAEAVAMKS